MSDDEKLRTVQVLRAKASHMEKWVRPRLGGPGTTDMDWFMADVALIAALLADHIERTEWRG